MFITLKPRDERDADAFQIIARLRPKLAAGRGRAALPAGGAGHHRRRPRRADAVPVHAAGRRSRRAQRLGAEDPRQAARRCRSCATSRPTSRSHGTTLTLTIDRDMAARFGIQPQLIDDTLYDAFGQRQVTQYFTQLNTYHVIKEVAAGAAGRPADARQLYIRSPTTGQMVPLQRLRQMDDDAGRAAVDQPPGPVPGGDAQLQSRARAWRSARRRRRSSRRERELGCRRRLTDDASRATRRRSRSR